MLQNLNKCNSIGSLEDILFCLRELIGESGKQLYEIQTLNQHAGANSISSLMEMLTFFHMYEIVSRNTNGYILVNSKFVPLLYSDEDIVRCIISSVLELAFERNELNSVHFSFNHQQNMVVFNNNHLPVRYAYLRNFLLSAGVLAPLTGLPESNLVLVHDYEQLIQYLSSKANYKITQQQLLQKLELQRRAGEKAELFAYDWERNRINSESAKKLIRLISDIDVTAGYDIVSVSNETSTSVDRFIEVKAVGREYKFYWSRNEINVASVLGNQYYIYLVELDRIYESNYAPLIINNPTSHIFNSEEWYSVPESYFIKKLEV